MYKRLLLIGLVVILMLLICANVFRYEQIEKNAGITRYIDRWTNLEWVKVTDLSSTSRMPSKYYNYYGKLDVTTDEVLRDLGNIKLMNDVLLIIWWISVIGISGFILCELVNANKNDGIKKGDF